MPVLDLKTHSGICKSSRRFSQGRSAYVFRPACVYPSHGLHAIENLSALRGEIPGQLQREAVHLHGSVPHHGFCTTGLSREPAGHRGLPPGAKQQTLSHGHPQQGFPQHPGGSERNAGLAHLRRFCPLFDRHRQEALPQGTLGRGTKEHGLCPGCHDDRPVSVPLSLGTLPGNKGGRPTSYPAGSAWQYPELHPHLRRKTPRGQRPGHNPSGGRRFLHHGSRLPGLLQTPYNYPGLSLLRYPGQVESKKPQALFPSSGQIHRGCVRSIHSADRSEVSRGLSRQTPPGEILRRRDRQNPGVSDQQLSAARHHHRPTLQTTVAGGAFLQVDQAEPAHQELLRNLGERREDPDLDCRFRLSDCSDNQKTAESTGKSLHNITGAERLPI